MPEWLHVGEMDVVKLSVFAIAESQGVLVKCFAIAMSWRHAANNNFFANLESRHGRSVLECTPQQLGQLRLYLYLNSPLARRFNDASLFVPFHSACPQSTLAV
jgi:hypothetical protein